MSSEKRKLRRAKAVRAQAQLVLDIEACRPGPTDLMDALGFEFKTGSPTGRLYDHQAQAYQLMANAMANKVMTSAPRSMGKSAMLAAGYGAGPTAFENIYAKSDPFGLGVDPANMTVDEWRWAVAFKQVLGVDPEFYALAKPYRRRYLEQHYQTTARNDSRKGRKAAKVISIRVQLILDEKAPYRYSKTGITGNTANYWIEDGFTANAER